MRRKLCQWTKHKSIVQNFIPRQLHTLQDTHFIVEGQDIDIEMPGTEAYGISGAPMLHLNVAQYCRQLCHRQFSTYRCHQIQKRLALKTNGVTVVN